MILVDSRVWIDHLRKPDDDLSALLGAGQVACHPFVIGEIACGHLRQRDRVMADLTLLPRSTLATHGEALALVGSHLLAGAGIGWADVHLLASTVLTPPTLLWTRDRRLAEAADQLGLRFKPKRD